MTLDDARSALAGSRFAELLWVGSTGSTNADLAARAREGGSECALVADLQTAGRGRLDRRWESPPGATLMMSVLVRGPFPGGGPHQVPTALSLSVRRVIAELTGLVVGLKWPNDLVVAVEGVDRKLGGVLAEWVAPDALVVGIGVNLAWGAGLPDDLAATATSMDLLGHPVDRWDLVSASLLALESRLGSLGNADGDASLTDAHRAACVTIGRRVRVEFPRAELIGTAIDVTGDGALVVEDDSMVRHEVTVGDVVHLRPA